MARRSEMIEMIVIGRNRGQDRIGLTRGEQASVSPDIVFLPRAVVRIAHAGCPGDVLRPERNWLTPYDCSWLRRSRLRDDRQRRERQREGEQELFHGRNASDVSQRRRGGGLTCT